METPINIHHDEAALVAMARSERPTDAHVEACPRCRALVEFHRAYLSAEAEELARPVTNRDMERLQGILSPGVYRLEPYQVHMNVRTSESAYSPVLLAALDSRDPGTRFSTIATFASQALQTIVRVVCDTRTSKQTVHLLASDESLSRNVEIGISDATGQLLKLRTDSDGVALLDTSSPIDWGTARLVLFVSPLRP